MKRKVSRYIEGSLKDDQGENITTTTEGEYVFFNDKHVIRYKEIVEDSGQASRTTLKISPGLVEMSKKGESVTHMVFDLSRETESVYDTQYGSLYFQVKTTIINIEEKENQLFLHMEYALSNMGNPISENCLRVRIKGI